MCYKAILTLVLVIGISNSSNSQGLGSSDMIGLMSAPKLNIESAQFIAGKAQMKSFIKEEMFYPLIALRKKIQGTVILTFVIKPDGSTNRLAIEKSVDPLLDEEAIRIFNLMLWKPAVNMGRAIATRFELPIKFNIKKYKKACKARGYNRKVYIHTPVDSSNQVYEKDQVESSPYPSFKKRNHNFSKFIADNIKYPEAAFKQNISGTVVLSFIIEPDGRASHLVPLESIGGGCDQEAIRLVKLLKWYPGLNADKAVRTRIEVGITFKLDDKSTKGYSPNNQQNSI